MNTSVEARGASVDEAVQHALRELGAEPDEVVIEVLTLGGRRGLFGGGKRAHVRVTRKAAVPDSTTESTGGQEEGAVGQQATDESERMPAGEQETADATTADGQDARDAEEPEAAAEDEALLELIDEEADLAADFLEGLLDLLDLPGDIEIEVHEHQATVTIQDVGTGLLIGRRGATLDALQELVRGAVQRQTTRRSHVRVDVEGYRARHLDKLRDKCRDAIAEVRESGEPVRLEPMDAYERKLMHDLVTKTRGVTSSSEGAEPRRRVVIHPED